MSSSEPGSDAPEVGEVGPGKPKLCKGNVLSELGKSRMSNGVPDLACPKAKAMKPKCADDLTSSSDPRVKRSAIGTAGSEHERLRIGSALPNWTRSRTGIGESGWQVLLEGDAKSDCARLRIEDVNSKLVRPRAEVGEPSVKESGTGIDEPGLQGLCTSRFDSKLRRSRAEAEKSVQQGLFNNSAASK